MALKNTIEAIPMLRFNAANLTANYQVVSAAGISENCFLLRIINDSTVDVTISYDGVQDNDYLIFEQVLQLPASASATASNNVPTFAKGKKIYLKGTAGVGDIIIAGYYQPHA